MPHHPGVTRMQSGIGSVFPASAESVELFIAGVHDFLAEKNLGGLAFDMELLAREALGNAVQHGCGGDPSRSVQASLNLEPGALILAVRDEGPGWDWRSRPVHEPDPECESGRGLFIIRKYSDSFSYNDQGNALTITKRVPTEEQQMDSPRNSTVRMALEPRLAAPDVPALRDALRASIQQGARDLELDFSRVESLDSMGIGLLVATRNSLVKLGGSLALIGVRKEILQLLTLMRLDKHISITPAGGNES